MSTETNKQTAEKLFATTAHEVLFANPKGEFFTSENTGALSLKPRQQLQKFERNQVVLEEKVRTLNQDETIAQLLKVETIEGLKAFELDERKGVKAAYTDQLAKLTAAIEVVEATGEQIPNPKS
ncbi:hypothetical protein QT970_08045 [Microcoleus sp. herbarium8]